MKLTIILEDNSIGKDGRFYNALDLSTCSIPANVRALQWNNNSGHIEYYGDIVQNDIITELPDWAVKANTLWQTTEDARLEAEAEYVAPPVPRYSELRQAAYAPLAEQLDMQYHDTMNGTETWLDHIKSVKEAHPKEGE